MFESPFLKRKVEFKKEDTTFRTRFLNWLSRVDELFLGAIPSDDVKQLPISYIYPVGLAVFLVLIGIFAGVFIPGYYDQLRTKFLAPTGSGNSKYCEPVTISNTGSFLASRSGHWEGDPNFEFSNGSYSLGATNYQTTAEEFRDDMTLIFDSLVKIGKYTSTTNLGVNLLFWSSWVEVKTGYSAQRFGMTGTPLAILNRAITVGTISNVRADCNALSTSTFNPTSGIMQVTYNVDTFMNNPNCSNTTTPGLFGYKPYLHSDNFNIKFDVRSVFTAVALNSHINSVLNLIKTASFPYPYKGHTYQTAQYVDPQFPGMKPVMCLFTDGTPYNPVCTIIVGNVYAIPIFNHAGFSFDMPVPCNCTEQLKGDVWYNPYNLCNVFNFLTGFIFYPVDNYDPNPVLDLLFKYTTRTGRTLNELSFAPMFTAGMYGQVSPNRSIINSPEYRAAMYDFCYSPTYGPCSIVTFNSIDESSDSTDWVVSDNFLQLRLGACSDTFSTSWENWNQLIEQPFAPLTQQYQTCSYNPLTAFFNQVGVSAGNVSLLSPLGVLLVLLLLSLYQCCTGANIPRGYSRSDKDAALDALALALLLVRDKRPQIEAVLKAQSSSSNECGSSSGDKSAKSSIKDTATGSSTARSGTNSPHVASPSPNHITYITDLHTTATSTTASNTTPTTSNPSVSQDLLLGLVDQLAALAAAAEHNDKLYHMSNGEGVYVDWSQLSKKMGVSSDSAHNSVDLTHTASASTANNNSTHTTTNPTMIPNNRTRADSDDDDYTQDVEMATVSKLHRKLTIHNTT